MTLIGKPQLPANTYRDFENYIRANSGNLNIAHAGLGSASHICGLLWQSTLQDQRCDDHHSLWWHSPGHDRL